MSFTFIHIASTDGERIRRHTVPVLNSTQCVVVRRYNDGRRSPPLFARSESSQSLTLDLARGLMGSSPKYIESKWACGKDESGSLVLPENVMTEIDKHLKEQVVNLPDGSTHSPWRLATAEEAAIMVEVKNEETTAMMGSILAQHGFAPRNVTTTTPVIDPGFTARIEAMEAELSALRNEKALREEEARLAVEKAALRAELLNELREELAAEAKAKSDSDKVAAEAAELVEYRAAAALKAKKATE